MSTVPMPNLGNVIESTQKRKVIFAVYAILAILVGVIGAYYTGAGIETPAWLAGVNSATVLLGSVTSGLALANVPSAPTPPTSYTPLASPTE